MSSGAVDVWLGEQRVGHLWSDANHCHFAFDNAYLDAPDRKVLGQHFEDRLQKAGRRYRKMHPWFENALPEAGGALRRRYARSLGFDPADSMRMLAALGEDLPGAVIVRPRDGVPELIRTVDEEDAAAFAPARFSLGGVQLKFSLSGDPERLVLGVGSAEGDAWILKVGTTEYPELAEVEHATMSWARAAGFDVPETRVVDLRTLPPLGALPDVGTGFLVRRYDRHRNGRTHQEDFAQVLNVEPGRKYDAADAAGVVSLAGQILGPSGAEEALRRLVLVVASGNADAHLKNWSLVYPDGVRAAWSPLYDQVATIRWGSLEPRVALRIGKASHFNAIGREHLMWVGAKAGLSPEACDACIRATVTALAEAYPQVRALFPGALAGALEAHWRSVPLTRDQTLGA